MTRFEVTTRVAAPPRRVFDLCLDVDVHAASMAGSGERVVAGVTSGRMRLGDTVTFEARHFGVRWRMTALITAFEAPGRFVDEQVSGPFRHWRHEHRFEPDGNGGTIMRDLVDFSAPFGLPVLDRYVERLIRNRAEHLRSVAEPASAGR
ncbi:SRPBCC family protein [Lentzea sp. NPDC034063]|uniref:SRPBCC family protein n=1 Tax=unclassified Lentzea TaxID=2643253 RepID=UPI0033E37122